MKFDKDKFNIALQELVEEAKKVNEILDQATGYIKSCEDSFNAIHITDCFRYDILVDEDDIDLVCLSWGKSGDKHNSEYRIIFTAFLGERCSINRPFSELKVANRLKYLKYLQPFLHAFKDFIKQKHESLLYTLKD